MSGDNRGQRFGSYVSVSSTSSSSRATTSSGPSVRTSSQLETISESPQTSTQYQATTSTRPKRSGTARPRTAVSTFGVESQKIICAVSESRGIAPTVGLAFVNLDTGEAILSQICDSQTYVRTIHKLAVFAPSQILLVDTSAQQESKLFSIIEENLVDLNSSIMLLGRQYWAEIAGLEYIQQLAFIQDVESIKISLSGNYFAVCCFAAVSPNLVIAHACTNPTQVIKYVDLSLAKTFPIHSLRIKYEASEGSMMIDLSTIRSLELNQNLQNPKSKDCLFGLLDDTLTPMGSRLLRSNILQPLTDPSTLNTRYDALQELTTNEEVFFGIRAALKSFLDVDKMLTSLIVIPTQITLQYVEQSINNVLMLKQFVKSVKPVFEALAGARSLMLKEIQSLCAPEGIQPILDLIDNVINGDIGYAAKPIELRYQRTYAIKAGLNGLLDVARQTYKEGSDDIVSYIESLAEELHLPLNIAYDNSRQYYIRVLAEEVDEQTLLNNDFVNVIRNKKNHECQTLDLMKRNQRIVDSHTEVLLMSDRTTQDLIGEVREHMSVLFKISEGIAMLDMLGSFAQLVTVQEYVRPRITETLAIQAGRHPIKEKIQSTRYIPNDVYATQQSRFQIITGCNMSGKSTYIRSIALMCVMAQIGSFVPAQFASFTIIKQLFARISIDDSIEANVSTFASEMRETAFILSNIDRDSLVIIDELGRGTSTRDGLAIALAIAEALVNSRALVWFATHFRDLAHIMSERNGVVNKHLSSDMSGVDTMTMLYKVADGVVVQEHYGLQLAKVLPFPPGVIEDATYVANKLRERLERHKKSSMTVIHARRRKVVLSVKEQLLHAHQGNMEDEVLRKWLRGLQREFVMRMVAIDQEAKEAMSDIDAEMGESISNGREEDSEMGESVSTVRGSEKSLMTVDLGEDQKTRAISESSILSSTSHLGSSVVEIMDSIEMM